MSKSSVLPENGFLVNTHLHDIDILERTGNGKPKPRFGKRELVAEMETALVATHEEITEFGEQLETFPIFSSTAPVFTKDYFAPVDTFVSSASKESTNVLSPDHPEVKKFWALLADTEAFLGHSL